MEVVLKWNVFVGLFDDSLWNVAFDKTHTGYQFHQHAGKVDYSLVVYTREAFEEEQEVVGVNKKMGRTMLAVNLHKGKYKEL